MAKHLIQRYLGDLHYQASMVESSYGSGVLDGRKEGKEEGRAEGRAETNIENAKKIRLAGIPDDLILQVTGVNPKGL